MPLGHTILSFGAPLAARPAPLPAIGRRRGVRSRLETLQPIGSFKIRGAWNVVRQLPRSALRDGVWTVSAGNAAQGVALAARVAGVPCSVMVVDTAPATKIRAVEQLGATVVRASYDECWRTVSARLRSDARAVLHPFDMIDSLPATARPGQILEGEKDVDVVIEPRRRGLLRAWRGDTARAPACRSTGRTGTLRPSTHRPAGARRYSTVEGIFGWRGRTFGAADEWPLCRGCSPLHLCRWRVRTR